MSIPTVLVLPYPAQGHVNPLMTLSQKLVEHGCKVIFVNTDFDHKRVVASMGEQQDSLDESLLKLVSIPDGLEPDDDQNDAGKLCDAMQNTMPTMLEKLIEDVHLNGDNKISLSVADFCMGWALDVGSKLGIKGALLWASPAALFGLLYNIPKLIDDGIIDSDGVIKYLIECTRSLNLTKWWLCNTTNELEPGPLSSIPKLVPIGPLLRSYGDTIATAKSIRQYWEEDLSCMSWLDQQPHGSVLYVAFGSFTHFDQNQFNELAPGIDLTNRPFLWVVRQDNKRVYPNEFLGSKGKIVGWAPQQKVLNHPAIACFLTHCGWNSTMEGLSNGVPLLCWPYFGDQLYNKAYICDELKVGLGVDKDKNGLVSRMELKRKVDQLFNDENINSSFLELKDKVMKNITNGGRSLENLNSCTNEASVGEVAELKAQVEALQAALQRKDNEDQMMRHEMSQAKR
ncbi:UDP-glycosyltransferase 83A1 [Glycine soja]|uniref:Glycosyltransferase n=1 Tax=Glycine soja TaxID=3848 RepID=A0A0B2QDC2_GLYSO|nr:UDP-glycosyltransferase 83A1 [Glycine soja]